MTTTVPFPLPSVAEEGVQHPSESCDGFVRQEAAPFQATLWESMALVTAQARATNGWLPHHADGQPAPTGGFHAVQVP